MRPGYSATFPPSANPHVQRPSNKLKTGYLPLHRLPQTDRVTIQSELRGPVLIPDHQGLTKGNRQDCRQRHQYQELLLS